MSVVSNLAYMLALLAVGFGLRRVGIVDDRRRDLLTDAAFYVALPSLVYVSTFERPLREVLSVGLLVGVPTVLLCGAALAWLVHRGRPDATRGIALVQSYHSNLGFLGLPVVAATFGGGAVETAKASVILGVGALTQVPLTLAVLSTVVGGDRDPDLAGELRALAWNPVLLALVAGLVSAGVGLAPPAPVVEALSALSTLALPVALLGVGASLDLSASELDVPLVGSVVAVKLLVLPVVAAGVFLALGVAPSTLRAGVVMFAMPTAVSTFVYAAALGGDADLASVNVVATTVASVATLLPVLWLLG